MERDDPARHDGEVVGAPCLEPQLPDERTMVGWIEDIVAQGVRRPGSPADRWTERFVRDELVRCGVEAVRFEPLECTSWHETGARLSIDGEQVACSAVPLSEPAVVRAELARFDPSDPSAVAGKVALCDVAFMTLPESFPVWARQAREGDDPVAAAGWAYDPDETFATGTHHLPFAAEMHDVMAAAVEAGAVGYIGVLRGYPGEGSDYHVPYDGRPRPIPGVYVTASDGDRLARLVGRRASVEVNAEHGTTTTNNVVGELPGADDEWVVVGTHHDGPWASAVEDATGVALLLAQARAWAAVPPPERPHRLVFLASAAHLSDGAGTRAFIAAHRAEMDRTVLEVHLEHAALDGDGRVSPRWWFTSPAPRLERSVWEAVIVNDLDRSLVLLPDALDSRPTTDGGYFHDVGVPLVNHLAAPWYLFDPADTTDKVDVPSLTSLSRAAWSIIAGTAGVSAAQLRAEVVGG